MSTSSNPNKLLKNSFHWRNDSGELDVFEASRYFSAAANDHQISRPAARRSLDMPIMRSNPNPPDYHHIIESKQIKDQSKKFKQPSSPGGRLATFLNSLFNQTPLKKKKKSSKSAAAAKDFEEESPGGRRKRRSSISHFRITSTAKNAAAADNGSGFRTPPPYAITPTKSYKELTRFAEHNSISLPQICAERNGADCAWIEEKLRVSEKINGGNLRKLSEEDDGAESDSSSDLFDLPNHDLDFFSSSLPVYESTRMERIRIATPISS